MCLNPNLSTLGSNSTLKSNLSSTNPIITFVNYNYYDSIALVATLQTKSQCMHSFPYTPNVEFPKLDPNSVFILNP